MSTEVRNRERRRPRRRSAATRALNTLLVIGALAGGIVFAYPLAAPWIADTIQADAVLEYAQSTAAIDSAVRDTLLADARQYNKNLPNGPLRDPYVLNESGQAVSMDEGRADYGRQLMVDPKDPNAAMARLTISSLDIDLPIFHGTDEATLSRGVGHFYGSGLPVGGTGVHTVLTAHSGYVNSRLFDDLPQIAMGDTFTITVLGEMLTYQVDSIVTALPDESEMLRQVSGYDYVTLVTCTPRYVNTHRLLVRGVRIETPETPTPETLSQVVSARDPGPPWWALVAFGPVALTIFVIFPRKKRTGTGASGQTDEDTVVSETA